MKLECRRDEDALAELADAWEALHARSATATIFNSLPYARLWWRHFGTPGALQLWLVWDGPALVGIAPLVEGLTPAGEPALQLLGGVDVSDYLDIVAEPGREDEVVKALLEGWADVPCHCLLDFHALPHASPSREAFLRLAPAFGLRASEAREEVCPVISLPDRWEAYLEQLEGKQRRELRRKLRKAGQEELVSWYHVAEGLVPEELEHFFELHARSGPDKATFMTPAMRAFFHDLAATFAARGWLDLSFLLVNGERAASMLAFQFRNEVLLYNSGFDASLSEGLSPGWLLLSYHIEEAIASGRRRYDFMRGDEEYKFRFGARSEPIYNLRMQRACDPL